MPETKSIWFDGFAVDLANELCKHTLVDGLGIEITEAGDDYVKGRMPVDNRTRQPMGVLHGGASVAFAETLTSVAANFVVDHTRFSCFGLEINANHIRSVREGVVQGVAKPVHLGGKTQVWETRIFDEAERIVCISRITIAVLAATDP